MIEQSYTFIDFLQSYRSPLGDTFFTALSFLGSEEFFLLLFTILYWVVNKRFTLHFALLFLFSAGINDALKITLGLPRPDPAKVMVLAEETSNGFPSGHAQTAVTTWGYIGWRSRQLWVWLATLALILGISLSRLYLGVHFIGDILGGWLVGLLVIVGYNLLAPRIGAWSQQQSTPMLVGVTALLPLFLFLATSPEDVLPRAIGAATGALWGCIWEYRHLGFQEKGATPLQIGFRLVIGLVVLLLIWRGLKPVLETLGILGIFLRYALIGLWLTGGAPWLFVRFGLAPRQPPTPITR